MDLVHPNKSSPIIALIYTSGATLLSNVTQDAYLATDENPTSGDSIFALHVVGDIDRIKLVG